MNALQLVCVALLVTTGTGQPQQPSDVQTIIDSVFGTEGSVTQTPQRSRGFGNIVTPEPFVQPTSSPQTLRENTADECTCVPYHMCDPSNNQIRKDVEPDFDGFGVIDIRFDARECQAVLDVCCKGQFQREETIPVKPVVQKPNRAAGCGIRNVGGIDFQLAGANVRGL